MSVKNNVFQPIIINHSKLIRNDNTIHKHTKNTLLKKTLTKKNKENNKKSSKIKITQKKKFNSIFGNKNSYSKTTVFQKHYNRGDLPISISFSGA